MGIKAIDHWVIVAGDLQHTAGFLPPPRPHDRVEERPGRPDMATDPD